MLSPVSFADYMIHVPVFARAALLVVGVTAVTLIFAKVFRNRILGLLDRADEDDGVHPAWLPAPELANQIIVIVSLAFSFVLALTVNSYWNAAGDARQDFRSEAAAWSRAQEIAKAMPAEQGGQVVISALTDYRTTITDEQWPALLAANEEESYRIQAEADTQLVTALSQASDLGASKLPTWQGLMNQVDQMAVSSGLRIGSLPGADQTGLISLIFLMGFVLLALVTIFFPIRFAPNLVLLGVTASVIALLLFILVEASNPFYHAVPSPETVLRYVPAKG